MQNSYRKRKIQIIKIFLKSNIISDIKNLYKNRLTNSDKIFSSQATKIGENLKIVFEELGPTFIKFGQFLSTRRDILPKEAILELEKLQDDVLEIPFNEIEKILEEELKKPINEFFEYFEKKPIASGSIAQVHYALLKIDNITKKVAVKIQRPNIKENINLDVKILEDFATKLSYRPIGKAFDLVNIVREFKNNLQFETDFNIEAENILKFSKYNFKDKYVHFPKVFKEISTKKVLIMEYVYGFSLKSIDENFNFNLNQKRIIANRIVYSYVNQFFRDGFFQADPHPGNIFINSIDSIYILDFGIMGKLSDDFRYEIMKIFVGVTYNHVRFITDALINMGLLKASKAQIPEFERKLQQIIDKYIDLSLNEMKLTDMFTEFFELLKNFSIQIPSSLLNFGKTVIILEGVIERLVENQSFVELAYPIAEKIILRFFSLKSIKHRAVPKFYDIYTLFRDFPKFSLNTLRQISDGGFLIKRKEDEEDILNREKIENKKILSIIFLSISILFSGALISFSFAGIEIAFIKNLIKFMLILTSFMLIILFAVIVNKFIRRK
ncbi:MAG: AarF/UbiB family protein [Peptoniphilaceae bacterium]|nr:AarF/UbiB family protein [Peptoniphilaceae bacterium]